MHTRLLTVVAAVLLWSFTARAADSVFYVEPKVGASYIHEGVSFTSDDTTGTIPSISASADGFGGYLGLNLGWQFEYVHVIIAGGITAGSAEFSSKDLGGFKASNSFTIADYGMGIGWEWNIPMMTTVYLKAFSGGATSVSGFGGTLELAYFISPTFKAGLGYTIISAGPKGSSLNVSEVSAGISFPIPIDYPTGWWRHHG